MLNKVDPVAIKESNKTGPEFAIPLRKKTSQSDDSDFQAAMEQMGAFIVPQQSAQEPSQSPSQGLSQIAPNESESLLKPGILDAGENLAEKTTPEKASTDPSTQGITNPEGEVHSTWSLTQSSDPNQLQTRLQTEVQSERPDGGGLHSGRLEALNPPRLDTAEIHTEPLISVSEVKKTQGVIGNKAPKKTELLGGDFIDTLNSVQDKDVGVSGVVKVAPADPGDGIGKTSLKEQFAAIRAQENEQEKFSKDKLPKDKPSEVGIGGENLKAIHFEASSTRNSGGVEPKTEITAQVVPASMAKNRLSSDAVIGVSTGITQASLKGGGEIRIKLKPEHLGELTVRVFTDGVGVGLKIRASDENAKKIIEDSMQYLKDSLSVQNLVLNQVDVSVGGNQNLQSGNDGQKFFENFQENMAGFQDQRSQHERQDRQSNPDISWKNSTRVPVGALTSGSGGWSKMGRGNQSLSSGKLDVMA